MKKHLRYSLGLMALSVAGIGIFMAVWLWSSFSTKQRAMSETATHILFEAVQTYAQLLPQYKRLHQNPIGNTYLPFRRPPSPVLLAQPMNEWLSVDTLRNIIQASLLEQEIDLPFSLDSVSIDSAEFGWEPGPLRMSPNPDSKRFQAYPERRRLMFNRDDEHEASILPIYRISSRPFPLDIKKQLFLQLNLDKPFWYIIGSIKWQIVAVAVLISLTVSCFAFMLYMLYRQKKLADIKNDFINNITHELKTPIATVSAAIEALQDFGAINDKKKAALYLDISRRELDHLSGLIEKVMDMAVHEHQEIKANYKSIQLADLLNQVADRYSHNTVKPVSLTLECTPARTAVYLDPLHMSNAISNLIDNAIKYSGDSVHIQIVGCLRAEQLEITVCDNGLGIDAKYQPHVFERFFRVPTGNIHNVKGYGLGLSYVKQVVGLHGGNIILTSAPLSGSTFKISIPLNKK